MKKLLALAGEFSKKLASKEVDLKDYRKKLDPQHVEDALDRALQDHKYDDLDVYLHNQHYGWFDWDWDKGKHVQVDINDFESDDAIKDVREYVLSLVKVNLSKYL